MDWNNAYLIPLYNALLIPVLIFGLGLIVEGFGNLLTAVISLFFGGSVAFFVRNRLTFIGTVHHELAHALFATLSGAKVTKIELFHVRGNQLGCVEFYTRGNVVIQALQMTLSSIAPVICGGISLCLLTWVWRYHCIEEWHYILTGYLFISIFFHMNMSTQDIKNAWKGMPLSIVICYLIFLFSKINLFAFFGISFPIQ